MKPYILEKFGSADGIILTESPVPNPGPNQVLVKIKAVSIARRDIYILNQVYPLPPRQGIIPLSEGVGEVVTTGASVVRFKTGDRVAGNYFANWRDGQIDMDIADQLGCTLDGMLAEYVVLNEEWLVKIPANLTWEEAATLPCAALTAWSALTGPRPVLAGDTVLTIGSGGVAVFAVQFAKMIGARVIALTSKNSKFNALRALGADEVINYIDDPDWHTRVKELTGGRGVSRVIETGGIDTFEQSVKAAAFGAEITLVSSAGVVNNSQVMLKSMLGTVFVKLINIRPVFVGSRRSFEAMNRAIEAWNIKPVIDKIYTFKQVKEAYKYVAAGTQLGKVIITLN
ncbi:zinc-dependent alcohol dehydrogenase family protein [Mucilaginibacter sp. SP1R1]|uniref:zinc-dependent alcohol dehydrogenase family protein n=1 Tax=Mucilaginibacter sp. SP1R1 TaxID=2723091 RepID=UPI001616479E|nr:NAD(P)-dependent alcohol dehydrogenase [Mucilaginibacter sp. SP1R1]MBB6150883.1 NADPH:quinone reductase-like Zn-dependent oxidoreductase [Mucilaginibacter sp. SP1R1]